MNSSVDNFTSLFGFKEIWLDLSIIRDTYSLLLFMFNCFISTSSLFYFVVLFNKPYLNFEETLGV